MPWIFAWPIIFGEYLTANAHSQLRHPLEGHGFQPTDQASAGTRLQRTTRRLDHSGIVTWCRESNQAASEGSGRSSGHLCSRQSSGSRRSETRTRPRKRKSLIAHLASRFGKKIPEHELDQIVATMIAQKSISETDGKLAYNL